MNPPGRKVGGRCRAARGPFYVPTLLSFQKSPYHVRPRPVLPGRRYYRQALQRSDSCRFQPFRLFEVPLISAAIAPCRSLTLDSLAPYSRPVRIADSLLETSLLRVDQGWVEPKQTRSVRNTTRDTVDVYATVKDSPLPAVLPRSGLIL